MLSMWIRLTICFLLWDALVMAQYLDGTAARMRKRLIRMEDALVKDGISKIFTVKHFRDMNQRSTAYQVGEILCIVRQLLNVIVGLYKQVRLKKISNDELVDKLTEVHNKWYTIENLIRMVEEWEEKKPDQRRSGAFTHIGGIAESKRWTLLREGERLDSLRQKDSSGKPGSYTKSKRKRWHAGNNE